jgi:hypothetical protein
MEWTRQCINAFLYVNFKKKERGKDIQRNIHKAYFIFGHGFKMVLHEHKSKDKWEDITVDYNTTLN